MVSVREASKDLSIGAIRPIGRSVTIGAIRPIDGFWPELTLFDHFHYKCLIY